ncbi:MAG TPA: ANTAR domain-containing protein [Nocardioidaceae bacterium]|nr:ANTAR domain-containing protein [Nocardioidaceae bacterium]
MTVSNTGPCGLFRYDVGSGTWWWSDPVYEIHGFTPGEVVPTTELILSHKHPDDAAAAHRTVAAVLARGEDFALWHRVVDARTRVRRVVSVGAGVRDETGVLSEVRGFMIDLTEAQRRSTAREIEEAVRASAESRDEIEQVKGALMALYAVDAEDAFELLRHYSQETNIKVREVARLLSTAVSTDGRLPLEAREVFDRFRDEGS